VTRRLVLAVLLAAVLSASGLSAARPVPAPQSGDWHVSLLASFDDVWQTVHDTYYDPAFGGVDWDAVRRELRPAVEHAASPAAARQVIAEMIARLGQSHFVILFVGRGPGGERHAARRGHRARRDPHRRRNCRDHRD